METEQGTRIIIDNLDKGAPGGDWTANIEGDTDGEFVGIGETPHEALTDLLKAWAQKGAR